jgi:hypothetical protein
MTFQVVNKLHNHQQSLLCLLLTVCPQPLCSESSWFWHHFARVVVSVLACAGCILMLTLQGQPAESDPYKLTKMIKEALGPDKIRFVEQQRHQQAAQTDQTGADAASDQQQDGEPATEAAADTQQEAQQQEQQTAAGSKQVTTDGSDSLSGASCCFAAEPACAAFVWVIVHLEKGPGA